MKFDDIDTLKEKVRDMEYDSNREKYIGKDGEELKITPYLNGRGYKVDYYYSNTYGNREHNSSHLQVDLNENWKRRDNDRDNNTSNTYTGSGCYLTTACMKHMKEEFDDNCDELTTLRWFRDNFVNKEDVKLYYEIAPSVVENINKIENNNTIYNYIYKNVVKACVDAIKNGNYEFAYNRYKTSVVALNEQFVTYNKNVEIAKKLNFNRTK